MAQTATQSVDQRPAPEHRFRNEGSRISGTGAPQQGPFRSVSTSRTLCLRRMSNVRATRRGNSSSFFSCGKIADPAITIGRPSSLYKDHHHYTKTIITIQRPSSLYKDHHHYTPQFTENQVSSSLTSAYSRHQGAREEKNRRRAQTSPSRKNVRTCGNRLH